MTPNHTDVDHLRQESLSRRGVSALEVVIAVSAIGLLISLAWPMILSAREAARRYSCQDNLRRLGVALHAYHDSHGSFPPAAVWETSRLQSLALHHSRRFDLFTHGNWAQMLLPFAGEEALGSQFDGNLSVAAPEHAAARNTQISLMKCPSDPYNDPRNPYVFEPTDQVSVDFGRGNYAINGGSHCFDDGPGSTAFVTGDNAHLTVDPVTRTFTFWGNGVAGFNVSFSLDEFTNGASTLVALEEVRAGIHPVDPRGVWSLGQIGGSITWAHGVNGDAYGPNNQEPRADDLLGCGQLHEFVGSEALQEARMPCVHYIDQNFQATARSTHPGGLNVLMLDGGTRFIADTIDPGLWHVLHSRETPRDVLPDGFEASVERAESVPDKVVDRSDLVEPTAQPLTVIENSLGMQFVLIPAGRFTMGTPDQGNSHDIPEESPPHEVNLTRPYYFGCHEVTQDQHVQVLGSNPSFHSAATSSAEAEHFASFPVEQVTWDEADRFCQRLSALPEERAAGRRYRLPTEAGWEYASRAGRKEPYEWSRTRKPDDHSGDAAGILPPLPVREVGSYPPNAFGLYDMRGNVWEWCADWFDRDYYLRSPVDDPQGPVRGFIKVVRGNDWTFVGEGCKISYAMMPPWKSSPFVGFRVVCEFIAEPDSSVHSVEN